MHLEMREERPIWPICAVPNPIHSETHTTTEGMLEGSLRETHIIEDWLIDRQYSPE
jgi:hypothetical protein